MNEMIAPFLIISRRVAYYYVVKDSNVIALCMLYWGNISSRFITISEANASEILENVSALLKVINENEL